MSSESFVSSVTSVSDCCFKECGGCTWWQGWSIEILLRVGNPNILFQSDPYVRVLVNNVIQGRTEVINNSMCQVLSDTLNTYPIVLQI